jgi:hypothetical protein
MLRGLKKPQILLAFTISLFVPILSGYLLYCDLANGDPFSTDAQYENADVDDLFLAPPDCQKQLQFFGSIGLNALFRVSVAETEAVEQVIRLCSFFSCFALVLRC